MGRTARAIGFACAALLGFAAAARAPGVPAPVAAGAASIALREPAAAFAIVLEDVGRAPPGWLGATILERDPLAVATPEAVVAPRFGGDVLRDASLARVPEPAPLVLVVLGLAALATRRVAR